MKFTFILLTIFCLHGYSRSFSQEKVSLKEYNSSLVDVIKNIRSQTGFVFFYRDEWLKGAKPVNLTVTNENINSVLERVLADQSLTYKIVGKMVVLIPFPKPEVHEEALLSFFPIKGSIKGADGRPLAGINVYIKNTSQGTITDTTGAFVLNVNIGNTLIISGIGFETKEIKIENETSLNIYLNLKTTMLDTSTIIVSNGYQVIARERANGSFTLVSNKELNEVVGTTILNRLPYMASGVSSLPQNLNINSDYNGLAVRGLSTITRSISKPLIILDNFEYNGNINNINPNDVESITVLKDAAAGSIWGARAGNGVIVITTKKGKFNQKTSVGFNENITWTPKPNLSKIKTISSSDFIGFEMQLFNNKFRLNDTLYPSFYSFTPVYEILLGKLNGTISEADANTDINKLRNHDVRDDYEKYLYRNNVNQQYSLSANGGSNNLSWNLSAGIDKNINQNYSKFNRYNFQIGSVAKLSPKLRLINSIYYTETSTDLSGSPSYGSIRGIGGRNLAPYTELVTDDGRAKAVYQYTRQGYIDTLGGGKLLDWRYYPLNDYKNINNNQKNQYLNLSLDINYQILKGIDFSLSYRVEKQNIDQKLLYSEQSYYVRDIINSFTSIQNDEVIHKVPMGGILDLSTNNLIDQQVRGQFNINKTIGTFSSLSAIVGSSISEKVENFNLYRTYGYDENNLTFSNVDYTTRFPSYLLYAPSSFIVNPASFSKTNIRYLSFYANGSYSLRDRYVFSMSARTDASNTFGLKTNDKFKPHYSIGFGWDIMKESFFKSALFQKLRMRITYGKQGNVDPSKTALTTSRYTGEINPYTQYPIAEIVNFGNPNLRWEQVAIANLGLDFSLAKNRISGSMEYFQKRITDMYSAAKIDQTLGRGVSAVKNVGGFTAKGFDLDITTLNINKKVNWSSNLILNYYIDRINKTYLDTPNNQNLLGGQYTFLEDYSPYTYFALKSGGLSSTNGDPLGFLNGKLSSNYDSIINNTPFSDLKMVGRLIPIISGSIGNNFTWHRFGLATRITYKLFYYFRRESINYSSLISNYTGHSDYAKRWQKTGDEEFTTIPSFQYPANGLRDLFYNSSDVLATKGDNIRLQYINLSYSIKSRGGKTLLAKNIELYFAINNIGIIWRANKEGLDPDVAGGVSLPKSYSVGLRGSF